MNYHSLDLGRVITPLLKYIINGNGDYIKVAQISKLSSKSLEIFQIMNLLSCELITHSYGFLFKSFKWQSCRSLKEFLNGI
jgi:hypothetical protein